MEHLWALDDRSRDRLVDVLLLLASDAAVGVVPPLATHALSGANLLLLVEPGARDAAGLPPLRPTRMPDTLGSLIPWAAW